MSTEPYTPSKAGMRDAYHTWTVANGNDVEPSELDAEFDRLIAKVRADALREAAETFDARLPDGTGNGRAYNSYRVAELLKARANEIEEEA